ncbi:MAG: TraX family protein [Patescibacteria group bacterium]
MINKNKKIDIKNTRHDTLKIIGVIAMVIDHIGVILYPQMIFLRVIGRLAFPIFAYYLTQGYIYTSNFKKYALRLFIFAVITQVPFFIATHIKILNIFFTLLFGLLAIHAYEKRKYPLLGLIMLLSIIIPIDYSVYGILTVLAFHIFQKKELILRAQAAVNILGFFLLSPWQAFGLLGSAVVLYYPKNLPKLQLNKYFFYFFYPVHLVIIYGISRLPYFAK